MIINVHAGHCPKGHGASGAVGIIDESTENRNVKNEVIRLLRVAGHTVYDCTCDETKTKSECLAYIVNKCNAHTADFDLSIHFNAGANDMGGNGRQTGVETWATNYTGIKGTFADRFLAGMSALGFKNRGKKTSTGLYVLNRTKAKACLIEVCFVDDADDVALYKKVGYKAVARVVAEAIHGAKIVENEPPKGEKMVTVELMVLCKDCDASEVRSAQMLLNAHGFNCGSVDGKFGSKTEAAVKKFQIANKIKDTGIVDKATWKALLSV